jgi:hypothetical protein
MEQALKFATFGSAISVLLCAAAHEWFAALWAFNAFLGYAIAWHHVAD